MPVEPTAPRADDSRARRVDVLIPTRDRSAALAVTLAGLLGQTFRAFDVVIADQSSGAPSYAGPEAAAVIRVLQARGHRVSCARNLPRRGLAQQRQFLFEHGDAPLVLFLDDDVLLEPRALDRMVRSIERVACGFVGSAVIGLSYREDERAHEQSIELCDDAVAPERVAPGTPAWARHRLHNAANLWHVARRIGADEANPRLYRVAWVGGCVLYDRAKLAAVGAFRFWQALPPEHCGEDVLAQLRVMERFGGCGVLPSGAFHLELPTTVPNRSNDAPFLLAVEAAPDA